MFRAQRKPLTGLPACRSDPAAAGTVVAVRQSLPLVEDLRLTDKVSQNLHADLLLFDIAGSRAQGLLELAQFLMAWAFPSASTAFTMGQPVPHEPGDGRKPW